MSDEGIIHLAGPVTVYQGVFRQRCVWCGAMIDERDIRNAAVQIDETASTEVQQEEADRVLTSGWSGWVEILGTNPTMKTSVEEEHTETGEPKAPERSCMVLLPREQGSELPGG